MLNVLESKLDGMGMKRYRSIVSNLSEPLPLPNKSADIIMAGWSLCYLASRNVEQWQANLQHVMSEMKRVLRKDGTIIIMETLGTGNVEPIRYDFLQEYFAQLEEQYGF